MGQLGEESSILYLSGYLLKINFTLDFYLAGQNTVNYEPLSVMTMTRWRSLAYLGFCAEQGLQDDGMLAASQLEHGADDEIR